jgi:integrase
MTPNEIIVVQSIVMQVTGPCKTESSQKPVPLDPYLAAALPAWRQQAKYSGPEDWALPAPA